MTFNIIKKNYDKGLWGEAELKIAVKKGVLTPQQFVEITQLSAEELIDSIDNIKARRLNELSETCENYIFDGFDIETTMGVEHFSLEITDQIEIANQLKKIENGATHVPYHSDNNACRLFTAEEIIAIATRAELIVTYHRTYFNLLKQVVMLVNDIETLTNIQYGMPLPEELDATLVLITGLSSTSQDEEEEELVVEETVDNVELEDGVEIEENEEDSEASDII